MHDRSSPSLHGASAPLILWCLVGRAHLLMHKQAIASMDRSGWMLPRLQPARSDSEFERKEVDAHLHAAGFDSVRRPLVNLGEVLTGTGGTASLARMAALALPAHVGPIPEPFGLIPLSGDGSSSTDGDRRIVLIDSLAWTGAHLYFSRPESLGRPKDYEIFTSLPMGAMQDDYINLWFPEAARELEGLGIQIEIDISEPQQILRLQGRNALLDSEIYSVQVRLFDLARHVRGRVWVTQIIDGQESVQDFTDPALARKLAPTTLSSE